jgi:hypothetical protein
LNEKDELVLVDGKERERRVVFSKEKEGGRKKTLY